MPNSLHRATIDDVAELAGVSIKTVSRVVNNEPNVRAATRAKVERAIAELHYRPNLSARNLASQRARVITLIYDDPSAYENPSAGYVMSMQAGVLAACRTADYRLVIHPCNYRTDASGAELQAMIEHARPQGIVLAAPLSNMPRIVRAIAATGTPMVRLSPGSRGGTYYSVATNDREISAEMTRYLASLGHRRIAFIKGHPSHKAVGNRYLGYLDGLQQSGLDFTVLDSGCCGMAGAFGFEKDHFGVSIAVGERVLLPAVREASADTYIVTNGFSCREQITQLTGRRVWHMAEILARGLDTPS